MEIFVTENSFIYQHNEYYKTSGEKLKDIVFKYWNHGAWRFKAPKIKKDGGVSDPTDFIEWILIMPFENNYSYSKKGTEYWYWNILNPFQSFNLDDFSFFRLLICSFF